jgi:hypothetical protein
MLGDCCWPRLVSVFYSAANGDSYRKISSDHRQGEKDTRTPQESCGDTQTGINVAKAEAHSSGLDDESAAEKAKGLISAKLGKAASIKITDIVPGKAIDSFCGVTEVEGAGGQRKCHCIPRAKNEVYFINGSDDRRAAMRDRL